MQLMDVIVYSIHTKWLGWRIAEVVPHNRSLNYIHVNRSYHHYIQYLATINGNLTWKLYAPCETIEIGINIIMNWIKRHINALELILTEPDSCSYCRGISNDYT